MMGKSLNKRHRNNDKELNNNTLAFYPFIHLKGYQNVLSKIINYRNK